MAEAGPVGVGRRIRCPGCGAVLRLRAGALPDDVRCPRCNHLLRTQRPNGSWDDPVVGPTLATAWALEFLRRADALPAGR